MSWVAAGTTAVSAYAASQQGGGAPARRTQKLPGWLREPSRRLASRAESAAQGMDFVPMSPSQGEALQRMEHFGRGIDTRGLQPAQTAAGAGDLARRTMQGDFLSPTTNPALGATIDAATGQVIDDFNRNIMPQIGSQAQRAGAWGGARQGLLEAGAVDEVTENIGDISNRMLSDAYNRERARQTQAMQMAPSLMEAGTRAGLTPAQILGDVGNQRRSFAQAREQFPLQREQQLGQVLGGIRSGQTTTSSREQPSDAVKALQGGLGGLQLYNTAQDAFGGRSSSPENFSSPWDTAFGRRQARSKGYAGGIGF